MARGTLIAENLRVGAALAGPPLTVSEVRRVDAKLSADERAAELADALAAVLDQPGWYADLHTDARSFVVFAGRVFAYDRGDAAGRAAAEAHGRARGVPEAQLDWP